jgi:phosphate transport system substrate-binding protein
MLRHIVVVILLCVAAQKANADSFVLQGSTTFAGRLVTNHIKQIEEQSSHRITVVPNKTLSGILALMRRQADFAMISGTIDIRKLQLESEQFNFPFDEIRSFEIARTRVAFAIHRDNPVTSISNGDLGRILRGEICNWQELGGADLPIRTILVRDGGGVQASVEEQVLGGVSINAKNQIRVQTTAQVLRVVEQERASLGLAQLDALQQSTAKELVTDRIVEQRLSLLTFGEPTPAMQDVIEAFRRVAAQIGP